MKKQTNKNVVKISTIMNRTWKLLLVVGLFGLCSELIFMIAKLAIVGNQIEGRYAAIWFGVSILCLISSGLIVGFIYVKPYIIQLWDWIYKDYGTKPVFGEGYLYVWLDTNTGKFSRPFSKEDVEKHINQKDLEEAKKDKWALIEYRSLNGVEFEF